MAKKTKIVWAVFQVGSMKFVSAFSGRKMAREYKSVMNKKHSRKGSVPFVLRKVSIAIIPSKYYGA